VTELALLTIFSVALTVGPLYQHAEALTANSVTASGTGTHKCASTQSLKTSSISFTAKGPFSVAGASAITGTLTKITGALPSYTAEGVVQINLCPGGLPGGLVTISGTCGAGTITFTSGTGSGNYKGFSICR
jgi:hypothetical protein